MYMYVYVYAYVYISISLSFSTYITIYIYIYTHTYTHTYFAYARLKLIHSLGVCDMLCFFELLDVCCKMRLYGKCKRCNVEHIVCICLSS